MGEEMNLKVLIAEDEKNYRNLLKDILTKQGYAVYTAKDGQEAVALFFSKEIMDLVILDVMMPKMDGFEVLQAIRQESDVPVLMLTALGDEINEVSGFDKGADDYITKPFSYPILIARVQALLRKTRKAKVLDETLMRLVFKRSSHEVLVDGNLVKLNNKEYQLLDYLIQNKNHAISRERILDLIWGYDYEGDEGTINTHIKTLRNKLGPCGKYIVTVKGTGYMFKMEA